jgi:hypothetical protein
MSKRRWDETSFFAAVPDNVVPLVRELYDWCRSQPGLKVEFGEGGKLGSFQVKLSAPGSPGETVLGVYTTGTIWPGFPPQIPEAALQHYRQAIWSFPGLGEKALENACVHFQMELKRDVETVKRALLVLTGTAPSSDSAGRII